MDKNYCQKKFGNTLIEIRKNGEISICNDWTCNWGFIYGFEIQNFKDGIINPCTGSHVQIIGMDSQPAKTHCNWIYDKIKKGYFDHLIDTL